MQKDLAHTLYNLFQEEFLNYPILPLDLTLS